MRRALSCIPFFAVLFGLGVLMYVALAPLTTEAQTTQVVAPTYTPTSDGTPAAPVVQSATYPDETKWYNSINGRFTWDIPDGVTRAAVEMATSTTGEPTDTYPATKTDLYVSPDMLQNGLQYVSVQFKNDTGWGDITFRPLLIDTIPPKPFVIKVEKPEKNTFPVLHFQTSDSLSGIDHYELYVPHKEVLTFSPEEAKAGYQLKELEDDVYIIRVTAVDAAGNKRDNTVPVVIQAGWVPPQEGAQNSPFLDFFSGESGVILVLLFVILGQFAYILYEKDQLKKEEEELRKETREVEEQMAKIFTALRNEIYDQIQALSKRSRMTKAEKEAVDGLNTALKVSETLVEREIDDINDILK